MRDVLIDSGKTILDAMRQLTELGETRSNNTLVVVAGGMRLIGTLTDGDVRRAFLTGRTPETAVDDVCKRTPVVAPDGLSVEDVRQLMRINQVSSIPIVDHDMKVVRVERADTLDGSCDVELVAVIMAGGEGLRLRPLTEDTPKPMLKVGGKPILQTILESLRKGGFTRIILNVRYLSHIIRDHFGDGSAFDVRIDYVDEPKPMGTAGSLGMIPEELRPKSPFMVVNGDLLCTVNFRAVHEFHVGAGYSFTLCGRPYEVRIPFGYPVISGDVVTDFREKPTFTHLVNSGIYCLSPELIAEVPVDEAFQMPDLIRRAIDLNLRVGVFPLREEFHEIGRPESYAAAEEFYSRHFVPQ